MPEWLGEWGQLVAPALVAFLATLVAQVWLIPRQVRRQEDERWRRDQLLKCYSQAFEYSTYGHELTRAYHVGLPKPVRPETPWQLLEAELQLVGAYRVVKAWDNLFFDIQLAEELSYGQHTKWDVSKKWPDEIKNLSESSNRLVFALTAETRRWRGLGSNRWETFKVLYVGGPLARLAPRRKHK